MEKRQKDRRSWRNSLLVEERFKQRLIIRVLVLAMSYVLLATVLMGLVYTFVIEPDLVANPALQPRPENAQGFPEMRRVLRIWTVGMAGITALFAVGAAGFMSNRIAGPLHRIRMSLDRIASGGEIAPISLRKSDDLREIVDSLNGALQTISSGGGSYGSQQAEVADERLTEAVRSIRSHVARLETGRLCQADSAKLQAWLTGLQDLLAKAEGGARLQPPVR